MAEMIGGGRPMTTCVRCKQTDDHPVCSVQRYDTGEWEDWHQDCHHTAFGDLPCHPHLAAGVPDGTTGVRMLKHKLAFFAKNGM
jgi:hypothetical protein